MIISFTVEGPSDIQVSQKYKKSDFKKKCKLKITRLNWLQQCIKHVAINSKKHDVIYSQNGMFLLNCHNYAYVNHDINDNINKTMKTLYKEYIKNKIQF